jgi:hypothetical protein
MSTFQIVVLIWLLVLTVVLAFTFYVVTRWVAFHDVLDDRVKELEQDKRGNLFAEEGLRLVRGGAERKKKDKHG